MAPPRLDAEFDVNDEVATVVSRVASLSPPPFGAWLLLNVVVLTVAEPEPMPPGAPNASVSTSTPPPPIPVAKLWEKVVPVTVSFPVPPVWPGDDGVYSPPPPLTPTPQFPSDGSARWAAVHAEHGSLVPPIVEFVIVRLPPVNTMPPPPEGVLCPVV